MAKKDAANSDQPLTNSALQSHQTRAVEIPRALPMRVNAFDLARHTVIAPNGKRYVVATFDDTHVGRGYVTAVYPQQNDYLTLIRLIITELSSPTPDEAIKQHISIAEAIQQGSLKGLSRFA